MSQCSILRGAGRCKKGYEIGETVTGKPVCVSTGKVHEVAAHSQGRTMSARSGITTEFSIDDPSEPGGTRYHKYRVGGATAAARKKAALAAHAAKFEITKPIKAVDFSARIRRQGEKEVGVPKQLQTGREILVAGRQGPMKVVASSRHGIYAVHKQDGGTGFNVTHVPTGLALQQGMTQAKAKAMAKYMHANAPGAAANAKFGKMPPAEDTAGLRKALAAYSRAR